MQGDVTFSPMSALWQPDLAGWQASWGHQPHPQADIQTPIAQFPDPWAEPRANQAVYSM